MWEVYDADNELRASCTYAEDAAVLVAGLGEGCCIKSRGNRERVLWLEGFEEQSASESYDFVAETVNRRAAGRVAAGR